MQENTCRCPKGGCEFAPSQCGPEQPKEQDQQGGGYGEETKLAVLIALVPAMTMTVFNLMGLI